jgi:spore coat polysaccharide biosynthesis protein SpsF
MITASINARMGSTRLPGKSLMDINGQPMLSLLLRRLRRSGVDQIVLATTNKREDEVLCEWATANGVTFFCGSETDVLQRTVAAHRMMGSDIVVRVCGDTPLIEPELIDQAVSAVYDDKCDIAMSTNDRDYPHGVSAHVCKMKDLVFLDENLTDPILREHVTLALYEKPGYRVYPLKGRKEWKMPHQRLQVDYPEDLDLVTMINGRLGDDCTLEEIVSLFKREPWLRGMNAHCEEKPVR